MEGYEGTERRQQVRRTRDQELEEMSREALLTSREALREIERHTQSCDQRYQRMDKTLDRIQITAFTTLLTIAGSAIVALIGHILSRL
jgi:hypothetical protein